MHVTSRINRLVAEDDQQSEVKGNLLVDIFSLEGDLEIKTNKPSMPAQSTPIQTQNFSFAKPIQVHKWEIKFSCSEQESVSCFLERIECLRVSRGAGDDEMFASAVELFTDRAFTWYLNNKDSFQNWHDLKIKLREDFLPHNYQENLLDEIKARKQGPYEKVTVYINIMRGLFNRLEVKPSNEDIIKIIRRNLLPKFVQHLAL